LLEEKSQNEPMNLYEHQEPERSRTYHRDQPDWTPSSTPEIIANEKSINPLNNSGKNNQKFLNAFNRF
jgi:hypothetical protein